MLQNSIRSTADKISKFLDDVLPKPEGLREDRLFEAMRYAALSKGKRVRPFLTIATGELFGVSQDCCIQTAAAIELIHSYSLVHDDLPSMDNDDMRRGGLSCHKKFDEATAILTGDALLTFAFEMLSDESTHKDSAVRIELISAISKAAGQKGMVGGQMMDLLSQNQEIVFGEIVRLQRMKTGALFDVACEAGAILGKAPFNLRQAIKAYSMNVGIAFQIIDDLLDVDGTREETGKAVRKDEKKGKSTLVGCIGVEKAREHASMLISQAKEHISVFDNKAEILKEFADYIINRTG